jgi:hypothetical protein
MEDCPYSQLKGVPNKEIGDEPGNETRKRVAFETIKEVAANGKERYFYQNPGNRWNGAGVVPHPGAHPVFNGCIP